MNTRKLINQTPVDEWELLNETVGRRPGPGTPLFEPHELGYACPVCDEYKDMFAKLCKKCQADKDRYEGMCCEPGGMH